MSAIVLDNVHKSYGRKQVLSGLSFSTAPGQLTCLLGPNGAGKSTTIHLLLGLIAPDKGKVSLFGHRPGSRSARRVVSATIQESHFPSDSTPKDVLQLVNSHYPDGVDWQEIAARLRLTSFLNKRTQTLSGGQRRRLSLAASLMTKPKVLLLDEPTVGLDIESRHQIWDEIIKVKETGAAIFLTTHHMDEAERLADEIVLLDQGKLRDQNSVQAIREKLGFNRVTFFCDTPVPDQIAVPGKGAREYVVKTRNSDDLLKSLFESYPIYQVTVTPMPLEEIVFELGKK